MVRNHTETLVEALNVLSAVGLLWTHGLVGEWANQSVDPD